MANGGSTNTVAASGRRTNTAIPTCSFCLRTFATLQSLGGHLTSHRQEIEQMRRQHEAYVAARYLRVGQPAVARTQDAALQEYHHLQASRRRQRTLQGIPVELLTPNHAYWESYRKAGLVPPLYNFFEKGVYDAGAAEQQLEWLPGGEFHGQPDTTSEQTVTDPMVSQLTGQGEPGEEAISMDLNFTMP